VFNKMDALPPEQAEALRERIVNLAPDSIFVSAREEEQIAAAVARGEARDPARGLEPMRATLRQALRDRRPEVALLIPMTHGKLRAEVHRMGEVLGSEADEAEGVMRITGRFEPAALARLERDGAVRG